MWSGNISFFLFFNNIVVCANPPIHYGPLIVESLILNKNKCVRIPSGKNIRKSNKKKSEMQYICIRVFRQRWEWSVSVCSYWRQFFCEMIVQCKQVLSLRSIVFFITAYFYSLKKILGDKTDIVEYFTDKLLLSFILQRI